MGGAGEEGVHFKKLLKCNTSYKTQPQTPSNKRKMTSVKNMGTQ